MKEKFAGYNNDSLRQSLDLQITPEKLHGIEKALGPEGIGTFPIVGALNPEQVQIMQQEIFDPQRVTWHDSHDDYLNERDMRIIQNHNSFALKLLQGDQSMVDNVPAMKALAMNIEEFVRALSAHFPNLASWHVDEMSLHRYDDPKIGLTYHKDNKRFPGIISVFTLEGTREFAVLDKDSNEHVYLVSEGDLMLTRATKLWDEVDANGKVKNLCPDHRTGNLHTRFSTSFITRANDKPNEQIEGFTYDNWKPTA